nr:MAG: putative RNA-dependent RNA polymerase [Botourmiaviridae sp.]
MGILLLALPSGEIEFAPFREVIRVFTEKRKKRHRTRAQGCAWFFDANPTPRPPPKDGKIRRPSGTKEKDRIRRGEAPRGQEPACQKLVRNRRIARSCVRILARDQGMKRVNPLPPVIACGSLSSAVTQVFGGVTRTIEKLSVKTVRKLEAPCSACRPDPEVTVDLWKKARYEPQSVDTQHLDRFFDTILRNVEDCWDDRRSPFVPNGHATLNHTRREGGNWREESLDDSCRVTTVNSGGKERIVTVYSSAVSDLLGPLHYSLWSHLEEKGWLLVGSPTNEKVGRLEGGNYVSVDYSAATDNIKTCYTYAMIEALIAKAGTLSKAEREALRGFACPRVEGESRRFTRGQPMGSLMSFPLLCLINKACFDMAITDLLEAGKISFKEWTSHRCLINGDDMLFRDLLKCPGALLERLEHHCTLAGLVVNLEKTMVDAEEGEINSTLFLNGREIKKTNVASWWMGSEVSDVVGFADRSCATDGVFIDTVARAFDQLARQPKKLPEEAISGHRYELLLRDQRVRSALLSHPGPHDQAPNPFPVEPKPAGFSLTRGERNAAVSSEIDRLRRSGYRPDVSWKPRKVEISTCNGGWRAVRRIFRNERNTREREEFVLSCLARAFREKEKEKLRIKETLSLEEDVVPPSDLSVGLRMIDWLRMKKIGKSSRQGVCPPCEWGETADLEVFE